jgi:hypothetical protein
MGASAKHRTVGTVVLSLDRGPGFETQHEVRPAADGPPIWTMWREPRRDRAAA